MKPPQSGRRPAPLATAERRRLLKLRLDADKSDPFATDPSADISEVGKLALRTPAEQTGDYALWLGDLCAERSITHDHRLRVFYVGKVLIAYQRATLHALDASARTHATRTLDAYLQWLLQVVEAYPTQRNVAVALWAIASDSDEHLPTIPVSSSIVAHLIELYQRKGRGAYTPNNDEDTLFALSDVPATRDQTQSEMTLYASADDGSSATRIAQNLEPLSDVHPRLARRTVDETQESVSVYNVAPQDDETPSDQPAPRPLATVIHKATLAADFAPGERMDGRYEVEDIKVGGMGIVYLCYDHEAREAVAIKCFQRRFLENERAVVRFEQEALTWIRLEKHPHIVQARLVRNIANRPHIILEHISGLENNGADLRAWIGHPRLTTQQAMLFGIHIALGMQHATNKISGLVHRDLKPANILVTHDGIAKVTDFGLVRSVESDDAPFLERVEGEPNDDARLTLPHAFVGTPPYMSPEQFTSRDVDCRADVYSFGVVLYEMLVGKLPFSARSDAWRHAHLHLQPSFPEELNARLSDSLRGLVLRCLAKSPADRPQTWRDIVEELSQIYSEQVGVLPTLAVDGTSLEALELMNKGYSLTELGRYEEALIAYDRAIALDEDNAWAWSRKGRALRSLHRLEEALACYDRSLSLQPSYAAAWNGRGIVLDRMNRLEEALEAFEHATDFYEYDVWFWYNRGDILHKLGRNQEAIATLQHALTVDPRHANTYAKLGQIYRLQGDYLASIEAYQQATALNDSYAWAYNGCGLSFKALGRYEEAVLVFRKACKYEPAVVWHWYNLTETLLSMARYRDALQPAREATRVDPNHSQSWGKLGQVYRYLEQYSNAINAYDKAIALDPLFDWAINGKGIVLEQQARYTEAYEYYRRATELNPERETYWYNQGNALYLMGKLDESLPMLRQALALNPNHTRSWATLASVLRQQNAYAEALDAVTKATEQDPTYAWAWHEMGLIFEAQADYESAFNAFSTAHTCERDNHSHLYKSAEMLFLQDRHEEALATLDRALRAFPRLPLLWAKRGQVLRKMNRLEESLESYTQAVELDPQYGWAWSGRGLTLVMLKQSDEALHCFRQAVLLDSQDVWAWYHYADELVSRGLYQRAIEALEEGLEVAPDHSESWAKLGQAWRSLGNYDDALRAYTQALELKPNFAWAWNGKGLTLRELGDYEEALTAYGEAVRLEPNGVWYIVNYVTCLLDLGRRDDALSAIERALLIAPRNVTVWARRGQVLRRFDKHEEALHSYDRALELDANYAWAWNGRGLCLVALGRYDEALTAYQTAVTHDPKDVWFWYNYAEAFMKLRRWQEAKASILRALELKPDHAPSRERLAVIQRELGE